MDKNLTLSVKSIIIAALVALAVVVAWLVGQSGQQPAASAATTTPAPADVSPGRLTMTGTGEVIAVPDQLTFKVAVGQTKPDLDEAMEAANVTMKAVIAAVEKQGVKPRDIQTTGLSMNPVYDYPQNAPQVLRGYRVNQSIQVTVRDLTTGGKVIGQAVEVGGNGVRVNGISLQVGDPEAVLEEARTDAVAKARAKAEEYAEATGANLGEVLTVKEITATQPQPVDYAFGDVVRSASVSEAAMPIRAGRDRLEVQVEVVWTLD